MIAGFIGAIDGAAMGQMAAGQTGATSIELWQSGCIRPSTHWQTHSASARSMLIARKRSALSIAQIRRLMAILDDRLAGQGPVELRSSAAETRPSAEEVRRDPCSVIDVPCVKSTAASVAFLLRGRHGWNELAGGKNFTRRSAIDARVIR